MVGYCVQNGKLPFASVPTVFVMLSSKIQEVSIVLTRLRFLVCIIVAQYLK